VIVRKRPDDEDSCADECRDEDPGEGRAPDRAKRRTASLKADLNPGSYQVHVKGGGIRPASVTVGRERESAQNELLQP